MGVSFDRVCICVYFTNITPPRLATVQSSKNETRYLGRLSNYRKTVSSPHVNDLLPCFTPQQSPNLGFLPDFQNGRRLLDQWPRQAEAAETNQQTHFVPYRRRRHLERGRFEQTVREHGIQGACWLCSCACYCACYATPEHALCSL